MSNNVTIDQIYDTNDTHMAIEPKDSFSTTQRTDASLVNPTSSLSEAEAQDFEPDLYKKLKKEDTDQVSQPNPTTDSKLTREVLRSRKIHQRLQEKKSRWKPTSSEIVILKQNFEKDQYPTKEVKEQILKSLNEKFKSKIDLVQLTRWFQHQRERVRSRDADSKKNIYKKFAQEELKYLQDSFNKNIYPKYEEMMEMARKLNYSLSKIENWYKHNRRALAKKGLLELKNKKYFKKSEVEYLQKCFLLFARPSKEKYHEMAKTLNCDEAQVKNWFSNKRKKMKSKAKNQNVQDEQSGPQNKDLSHELKYGLPSSEQLLMNLAFSRDGPHVKASSSASKKIQMSDHTHGNSGPLMHQQESSNWRNISILPQAIPNTVLAMNPNPIFANGACSLFSNGFAPLNSIGPKPMIPNGTMFSVGQNSTVSKANNGMSVDGNIMKQEPITMNGGLPNIKLNESNFSKSVSKQPHSGNVLNSNLQQQKAQLYRDQQFVYAQPINGQIAFPQVYMIPSNVLFAQNGQLVSQGNMGTNSSEAQKHESPFYRAQSPLTNKTTELSQSQQGGTSDEAAMKSSHGSTQSNNSSYDNGPLKNMTSNKLNGAGNYGSLIPVNSQNQLGGMYVPIGLPGIPNSALIGNQSNCFGILPSWPNGFLTAGSTYQNGIYIYNNSPAFSNYNSGFSAQPNAGFNSNIIIADFPGYGTNALPGKVVQMQTGPENATNQLQK